MDGLTPAEKAFAEEWSSVRKNWNWGKKFKNAALFGALPIVIMIDLINFFIIGDVSYALISFEHLFRLLVNMLWMSVVFGFTYNLFYWNTNEIRYKSILRKQVLK